MNPGECVAHITLTDVAKSAGVSLSTASLAFSGSGPISEKTKQKVLEAAAELGYHGPNQLAASLRRGRTGVVAVIAGDALRYSFRDPVSIQVLDGITATLGASGYGMLLIPSKNPSGAINPLLATASFDAAVLLTAQIDQEQVTAALGPRGIPVVFIGHSPPGAVSIAADDRTGMARLAEHLMLAGHDRVGMATLAWTGPRRSGPVDVAQHPEPIIDLTTQRYQGLIEGGATPMAVWECARSLVEEGISAGTALLSAGARTLVGFSDLIAAGLLIAAREAGWSVPSEVAVAGFDGIDLPWLTEHRLTTVRQPLARKGQLAAEAAIRLAEGEMAESIILEPELVIGTST